MPKTDANDTLPSSSAGTSAATGALTLEQLAGVLLSALKAQVTEVTARNT